MLEKCCILRLYIHVSQLAILYYFLTLPISLILDSFPWANISPTLHKVLAHSEELLREMNAGHGFKCFSEEGSEACCKLIRRYREHLARKTSFEDNIIDVFVSLASESDPVLVESRSKLICDRCGEHGHTKRTRCCNYDYIINRSIDSLVQSLII